MIINDELITPLIKESKSTQRKRKNYNFHNEALDPIHRMLNVLQPDSYVRPHKHEAPDKREAFILISGSLLVVLFDTNGNVEKSVILDRNKNTYGIEIQPGIFHTIIALQADTVVYEVKDGPYDPLDDKHFATWSPKEGSSEATNYITDLIKKAIT